MQTAAREHEQQQQFQLLCVTAATVRIVFIQLSGDARVAYRGGGSGGVGHL